MLDNKKGFTLIELLAVAVFLGVLGLIIIPIITRTIEKSRVKAVRQSAVGIIHAAEVFRGGNNHIFGGPYTITNGIVNGADLALENASQWISGTISDVNGEIILANFYNGDYCVSGKEEDLQIKKGAC